jgi:hypothetical protein
MQRIRDVEQDAIARAGARGDALGRKHGDVVTLVGDVGVLCVVAMVAAAPQTGDLARRSKHPRPVDNPGGRGAGDGDLDHVNAEPGGAIVALDIDAARQFLAVAHIACARDVDDDPVRICIDN